MFEYKIILLFIFKLMCVITQSKKCNHTKTWLLMYKIFIAVNDKYLLLLKKNEIERHDNIFYCGESHIKVQQVVILTSISRFGLCLRMAVSCYDINLLSLFLFYFLIRQKWNNEINKIFLPKTSTFRLLNCSLTVDRL